jgi:phospho-N-acetylmuramoyl-pentapeptide-transferase
VVLLGLFVCMGLLGFLDDYLKVTKRNSDGLNKRGKLIGQALIGAVFGSVALYFPSASGLTVGSTRISFVRDVSWLEISQVGAVLLFVFVVMAMSNAVNLTDGLDGLATGTSVMVIGSYAALAFWQYRHWIADPSYGGRYFYEPRDPLEIALIAGACAGACFGFLWWNASPARIFMGDTGSMALGALIAGLAAATKTIMLLPILTVLFFIITVTWVMQIGSYRLTGRRIFRMVPLQHHFELAGWSEVNIVIRFWIVAGLGVAASLGLFYADFLREMSGAS